jgi:hypothetical protein
MAFNKSNFDPTTSGSKGTPPRILSYTSADALATIMASGYFNSVAGLIRSGDLMVINSTAAADGGVRLISLVNTDNVITSVNAGGGGIVRLPFEINATDLSAGTAKQLASPIAGRITKLVTNVQVAIVTGGAVTVNIGATPVDGLSITVANSAVVGTVQSDAPTAAHASAVVAVASAISIVPAAGFDGGGALTGYLEIELTT